MIKFPLSEVLAFNPKSINISYGEQVYQHFNLKRFQGTEYEEQCERLRVTKELPVRQFMAENIEIDVLRIPRSRMKQFRRKFPQMRYGQELHNYLELYKSSDPRNKRFGDALYMADKATAEALIKLVIDEEN